MYGFLVVTESVETEAALPALPVQPSLPTPAPFLKSSDVPFHASASLVDGRTGGSGLVEFRLFSDGCSY